MIADSDVRGWIMSAVSGAACVLGATVICIDLPLRRLSFLKSFQIAKSNGFLSASLCLSAGVMIFSSLYSMLPTSKKYLTLAGLSARASGFILIGLFLAGVVVIRILSTLIHHHIPSHVVDCAHAHGGDSDVERGQNQRRSDSETRDANIPASDTENTPLLRAHAHSCSPTPEVTSQRSGGQCATVEEPRRAPFRSRLARSVNILMGNVKPMCDNDGPCYGFSQACGYECRKTSTPNSGLSEREPRSFIPHYKSTASHSESDCTAYHEADHPQTVCHAAAGANANSTVAPSDNHQWRTTPRPALGYLSAASSQTDVNCGGIETSDGLEALSKPPLSRAQHHHHVPQNAFLSIGLQTLVAITLHKLPEGFITYATNHASPTLGLSVFLALSIHNVGEGFAMALPLYLALHSRWKAIFWSSILGGLSQPAGAGLAALSIYAAQKAGGHNGTTTEPSWGTYGCMFAATAGVMTSVALQLFSEGLALTHNRGLGIGFAVAGMGLMGFSFALTA